MAITELDLRVNKISKARFDELVENGTITSEMLSNEVWLFVDDMYVNIDDIARWNNKSNLQLGEGNTEAFRGDLGKQAYSHSQTTHAPADAEVNKIDSISINGNQASPINKKVNIQVPKDLQDLNAEALTNSEIDAIINSIS